MLRSVDRILGAVIAACLGIMPACGTSANLHLKSGAVLEGKVVDSDSQNYYIGPARAPVRRDEVVDIDHPGNAVMTVGICVGAVGAINLAHYGTGHSYSRTRCDASGTCYEETVSSSQGTKASAIILGAGLGMALYGALVWSGSKSRAEEGRGAIQVGLAPFVVPTQDGAAYGAVVGGRF